MENRLSYSGSGARMTYNGAVEDISNLIEAEDTVSAQKVLEWMQIDDIQVHAAIVVLVSEYEHLISPPLENRTVFKFCLNYSKRCLLEDPPEGEFLVNRTVEGYTLQQWLKALWKNRAANADLLAEMKREITETYKVGDDGVKKAIETAVLEHLFEEPEITNYFSDWQDDPVLKRGYDFAREWSDGRANKREMFNLEQEPTAGTYQALLLCALDYCDEFSLVVRPTLGLDPAAELLLDRLAPFLISAQLTDEWPGTRLLDDHAELYRYKFLSESSWILAESVEGLYQWRQPDRPEDLCLIRFDGHPWLVTIAHERSAYLELLPEEEADLTKKIPTLRPGRD